MTGFIRAVDFFIPIEEQLQLFLEDPITLDHLVNNPYITEKLAHTGGSNYAIEDINLVTFQACIVDEKMVVQAKVVCTLMSEDTLALPVMEPPVDLLLKIQIIDSEEALIKVESAEVNYEQF